MAFKVLVLMGFAATLASAQFGRQPSFGGFGSSRPNNADASPSPSGCALIIPGPQGGSSADVCITYEDVNSAFLTAKDKVGLPPVKNGDFKTEDVGNLGTVIHEATRILAQQYRLSRDAISNGLPLIDTKKTVIEAFCPPFLKDPECKVERYRSITGACNNLETPLWGAANIAHIRAVPPVFADGISEPRVSVVNNQPLPSARVISTGGHPDDGFHDHAVTITLVAWGQFMDHDVTLTAEAKDLKTQKSPKCCVNGLPVPPSEAHPLCFPIEVPANDAFYSQHKNRCINFSRNEAGLRQNCRLGPRTAFNTISSYIDAGTVYSNSEKVSADVRLFKGGLLKMLPVFEEFNMKPLLPLKLENPNEGCIRPSEDVYCFLAGDGRVNEQTVLAIVHTLMVREHNFIAENLAKVNPHWNDETVFQEAKHINTAIIQHITFNEWLPMVLGKEVMQRHQLVLQKNGYFDGYDPKTNPSSFVSFVAAAFRLGHTLLPSTIERWSKSHRYVGSQRLSELLQQPYDLYKGGWADNYMMGLINQVAQAFDNSITSEVTNHLFQEPGKKFGMDLVAINLQRGRELGMPGYNAFREWCGFPRINRFEELEGIISNVTLAAYRRHYQSPDDIDLWSAGVAEKSLPGAMTGPTFACIIGRQFHNLKFGDRFWYENGGWPSSFTLEQLAEIRKIKLSRVICDNSDNIENVQVYAMVLPDHEINPRVPCKSGVLPQIDFSKWRDASFHSSPF